VRVIPVDRAKCYRNGRDEVWSGSAGRPGFTLVEVLLAVALSASLLTVVYWTYFSISRSIDAATESQEAWETGRILSELIKKDIRGISTGRFPVVGKNDMIDGRPVGQIEFVTTARLTGDQLTLNRIGYALVTNDRNDWILVRKESTNLNDPLNNTARVFEVSRIINGFQLEFFNGTDWVAEWDSTSTGALPKQIRVIIDVADAKGNNKRFTAEESIRSST
jgi:prepilin-type N-terminal cleavage/methylation domain-containing protein